MNPSIRLTPPLPPRLTMDDYVAFVSESLRQNNRKLSCIQKELEERISETFCLIQDSKNQ